MEDYFMFVLSISAEKEKKRTIYAGLMLLGIVLFSGILSFILRQYREGDLFVRADSLPGEKIIILDAGHGGEDSGAVGIGGVLEKDLNLAVTLAVGELLEKEGYTVVYTRTEDKLLYGEDQNIKGIRKISDLKNRCKIAENYADSLFVSIHMNSFGDSKYSGLQVYYSTENESSRAFAESVQNKVRELLQPDNDRKTKNGKGIYLLENISNEAILIECGFLTNEAECKKLSEKEYQNRLSFSIVCGIIEYIENN